MTEGSARRGRKQVLLRLDPAVHDALSKWAADELRSTNAQIDYLLRQALKDAGRLPRAARPHPRRGRPARNAPRDEPPGDTTRTRKPTGPTPGPETAAAAREEREEGTADPNEVEVEVEVEEPRAPGDSGPG